MKNLVCLPLAFLAATLTGHADQSLGFPKEKPAITLSLPDGWDIKKDDAGMLAAPSKDDDSVIIEVSELEAPLDDAAAAEKEAKETMSEFKDMKYDEKQKGEKDGLNLAIYNATGKDENGKAFINLVLIAREGQKHFFLLSCISSKEGISKHGEAISNAIQTLKAK